MVSFSSSTFVQTVSINYEDFNESFLTCGTCLCLYDASERSPKLLPCSHTICRQCLEQIVSSNPIPVTMLTSSTTSPASGSTSSSDDAAHHNHHHHAFRCPICRESIPLPVGGVAALRPNFLVNQLLDLMAQQRREVVPKCSELLFCETCDMVFCQDCNGSSHSPAPSSSSSTVGLITDPHTVIPFSIAIKRMSEILLYKAKLCIKKLNEANGNIMGDLAELDARASATEVAIATAFDEIILVIAERRAALLTDLERMASQKRAVLLAQAEEIRRDRSLVEAEVDALNREVEVRSISGKINELTAKLETLGGGGVAEPRENAFLCFDQSLLDTCLMSMRDCLTGFGAVRTSTTHPSLSSVVLPPARTLVTNLECRAKVVTVDYGGRLRVSGKDPVAAKLVATEGPKANVDVPVHVIDNEDGTYDLVFIPVNSCQHRLEVKIFNRPLKDSPVIFSTSPHINPDCSFGHCALKSICSEDDATAFLQPVAAVYDPTRSEIFVLDSGNCRIKVLACRNDEELVFKRHLECSALEGGSATGLSLCADDARLAVVNWRTKKVTKFDPDEEGNEKSREELVCASFVEPTGVAVAGDGSVLVLDNGAKQVMLFSPVGKFERVVASTKASAVAFGPDNEPVVAVDSRILVFELGRTREISAGSDICGGGKKSSGSIGGLAIDAATDTLLATRSEKFRTCIMVFDFSTGKLRFIVDSPEEKLRRPAGVTVLPEGRLLVADWGNDCVRKYRFR